MDEKRVKAIVEALKNEDDIEISEDKLGILDEKIRKRL